MFNQLPNRRVFISYRRDDSRKDAGRIYDRLVEAFGKDLIFKDIDDIPIGSDFRGVIIEAVASCEIILVLVGQKWLSIKDIKAQRRLDDPNDFVRIEVETALRRNSALLIPILVDGASMPQADELPLSLREMAFKNAFVIRDDPDFHRDVTRLIDGLKERLNPATKSEQFSKETRLSEPLELTNKRAFDVHTLIAEFYHEIDNRNWDKARELLAQIRSSGKAPRFFDVDAAEKTIWTNVDSEEAEKEYNTIRIMTKHHNEKQIYDALSIFWETYPSYDPDNLLEKYKTSYDVILKDGGPKKINVIKVVRLLTNLGLKEAKDLVEAAPQLVLKAVDRNTANEAKRALEAESAVVTID